MTRKRAPIVPAPESLPEASAFWKPKTLLERAAEQGVRPVERLEQVLGQGADLWTNDEELDAFLEQIRAGRRTGE
jgi:hypothetical protein